MDRKNLIELRNVVKHYKMGENIVKALDGINLNVEKGDFVAIMGPSGSGKSTGMNLTGSLDLATEGEIFLDGENIENMDESELAQLRGKKVGFIFQRFNLIPNLNVQENVMLPMLFQGVDEDKRKEKSEELLESVGLGERISHFPNELSGGEMQRVAIARAMANDPEIILADEPTGNLDTKTGEKVMQFLDELNRKGRTIIVITHDPEIARKHAKIIYSLKDGKIDSVEKKIGDKWKKIKHSV